MDRQDGKYFTIWYGVYRPADGKFAYCNAGHPPACSTPMASCSNSKRTAPPSAWFRTFPTTLARSPFAGGSRLLIYSDGVFEIEKPDGQMWQFADFVERITPELARDGDLIERHLAFCPRDVQDGDVFGDDFSMVEVRF